MSFSTCLSRSTKQGTKRSPKDKNRALALTLSQPRGLRHALFVGFIASLLVLLGGRVSGAAQLSAPQSGDVQQEQPTGVFGSLEFRTNATKGLEQWNQLLARLAREQALYRKCDQNSPACPPYLHDWRLQLKTWQSMPLLGKLEAVNAYVNTHIQYTDDKVAFGRRDLWVTPAVSLKGRGDCEDYAVAKYESLRALGIPEESLRLVIVDDTRRKLGHAVLTVNTTQGLYVLDNLRGHPYLHGQVAYYTPIYSINRAGRWINIAARKLRPTLVASSDENLLVVKQPELRPTLTDAEDSPVLRPSLTVEPANGTDLLSETEK